jgi:hypothetical protein
MITTPIKYTTHWLSLASLTATASLRVRLCELIADSFVWQRGTRKPYKRFLFFYLPYKVVRSSLRERMSFVFSYVLTAFRYSTFAFWFSVCRK